MPRNNERYREYQRKWRREHPEAGRLSKRKHYPRMRLSILAKQKAIHSANKQKAVDYLGGKCSRCLNTFEPFVYDFHHRDPKTKERSPASLFNLGWEKIVIELDKCDLVCANCHRHIHHGVKNDLAREFEDEEDTAEEYSE